LTCIHGGFASEDLKSIDEEMKRKGIKLKEMIESAVEWSKNSESLNKQLGLLQEENRKLEEKKEKLRNQIVEYEREQENRKLSLQSLTEETRRQESQRDALKKEVADLKRETEEFEKEKRGIEDEISRLEEVFSTLDQSIITFKDLVNKNAELRKELNEMTVEFNRQKGDKELSHTLLGLLRGSQSLDRNAMTKLCENVRDGRPDICYISDNLKNTAINALVNLTSKSVVILYTKDKDVLKVSFVNREEYEAEKKKWNEIELRNIELKSFVDQLARDCIGTVESVMDAKTDDPVAKEFVKYEIKEIVEKRIRDAYESIGTDKTILSFKKAAISIVGAIYGKRLEEKEEEKFIPVAYANSSGKKGRDILYFERIIDALKNNKDVEGSAFVYSLCDVLRAIFIHYTERKDVPLIPLRKRGEFKIVRGGPPIKREVQNPSSK
jgi:hypothetical protein